jgi:two-component system CheB/CheR fusion protein
MTVEATGAARDERQRILAQPLVRRDGEAYACLSGRAFEDWFLAEKKSVANRLTPKAAAKTGARGKGKARSGTGNGHDADVPGRKPAIVVVGIGASAGGLAALKTFFGNVADDSGLAYVVVVHLSPEHESHLAVLLQPHVRMPVLQVAETLPLRPNCVYVIPPNANLGAIDTHLRLQPLEKRRVERAPIDHFFRTLADTHDAHAIGVILTGTGSDGTLGLREIKLRGGLAVVQDPNEAEFDGMPQSAVATGFVDLVLPLASIPGAVLRFARTEPRLPEAVDDDPQPGSHRLLMQKVFSQVRARTGRDFTRYKPSTIMRRIRRRMQLRHIVELERYVELLRDKPDEVRALADDLLINVTSFFRDPEVFEALEKIVIPKLFKGKEPDQEIRIWCVGCATGEEVYSVAMLVLEEAARRGDQSPKPHIFASDLHERSLDKAREAFYPGDIAVEVTGERLKRFFNAAKGGYRIRKVLRETVVFASHNLLSDPPFSRLDLILCRNLLIYLQRDVQADVLKIFHYALRPSGYLVLGTSETIDDGELFRTVDKDHALYRRGTMQFVEPRLPVFPVERRDRQPAGTAAGTSAGPLQYEPMHRDLVEQYAPPSALVGPDGQLVHLSENAGRYLQHPAGRLTASATKLVRKELAVELIAALHAVRHDGRALRTRPVPVKFNGETKPVVLNVRPSVEPASSGYSLVIFEELDAEPAGVAGDPSQADSRHAMELARELETTRQRLQTIVEEFETSQEEMKVSNEELQSTNEELRSTLEELETSKEELQSVNEELQIANQENRHKVEELAHLSGDLQNLLTSTDIATLFLDRELRILSFTPKVADIFNMRRTDRGRPISDLTHKLGYPDLKSDAETVLRQLTRIEHELKDERGRWYLTHLLPYRSSDDRIAGVVITFVDITRRKQSEEDIRELSRTLEQRVTERTQQVRHLTSSLVRAEQRERRRLSETLHDELQQLLYGAQLKLRLARDETAAARPDDAMNRLTEAETLLLQGTRITRQLSVDLNPPILKHEGVRSILGWLRGHMKDLHGLDVRIDADEEVRIEDADVRVLMFQIFRELLFNVAKHSGATVANVTLKALDEELLVGFADDGKGFDTDAASAESRTNVGLHQVEERVGVLGGRIEIASAPGEGTTVTLHLPKTARIGD